MFLFFFFKQKTEYEVRISDWSSDVCSSDLEADLFPPFRKGRQPVVEPAHVLRVMRDVQKHHGQPLPETVTAPFRTAGRLVCTLPELDPYAPLRRDPVLGPVEGLKQPLPPHEGEPHFFAYVSLEHKQTRAFLPGLGASTKRRS